MKFKAFNSRFPDSPEMRCGRGNKISLYPIVCQRDLQSRIRTHRFKTRLQFSILEKSRYHYTCEMVDRVDLQIDVARKPIVIFNAF